MTHLLILGGTSEAHHLSHRCAEMGILTTVSLAGRTRQNGDYAGQVRIGGFGGADGLADWMQEHSVTRLIDATHPFAHAMPWNAFQASTKVPVPRLRLLRPRFVRRPGWSSAPTLTAALHALSPGTRVLLTTGWMELDAVNQRPDLDIVVRTIEPVATLPRHVTAIQIRPPLSLQQEHALLAEHRIEALISKDSGGTTAPKLQAASEFGARVILVDRQPHPPGPTVETPDQAVAWLNASVAFQI